MTSGPSGGAWDGAGPGPTACGSVIRSRWRSLAPGSRWHEPHYRRARPCRPHRPAYRAHLAPLAALLPEPPRARGRPWHALYRDGAHGVRRRSGGWRALYLTRRAADRRHGPRGLRRAEPALDTIQ